METKPILKFFTSHHGYATTADLQKLGVHSRDIKRLVEEKAIEKIKHGFYRLANLEYTPLHEFIEICKAIPRAVICLYSALSHYDLTTFVPTEIMIALPRGYHPQKIQYPPHKVFHFSEKVYQAGIETKNVPQGNYRIYCPEKSVCDAFRYRKKLGEDTAKESLYEYLKQKNKNIGKLLGFAEICRMTNIMKPYIEARLE